MEEIMYQKSYQEYKAELDAELQRTAEGFVRIGYLLRVAQDTNILSESGYANVNEFAMKEYGLDKSQVSRFIRINERFSEGGYSERLQENFRGYGNAKLGIMLTLPDEINAELSQNFSKTEIQTIKEEFDEENRITDLEVLMEGQDEQIPATERNLYKVLWQLGKSEPEMYVKLHGACKDGEKAVYETMVPDEEKIFTVRLQGVGKLMLTFKGMDKPVTLINMRNSEEKEQYEWKDAFSCIERLMEADLEAKASWSELYGEEFPKKPEVAPVQQEKKETPRKESKVHTVKKPEPKTPEPKQEPEEQIEGQDNIMDHPEYLPDSMKENAAAVIEKKELENVTKDAEIVEKTPLDEPETTINTKSEVVSELPAAVMEESEDWEEKLEEIWDRMELNAAKLNLFVQDYKGNYEDISKECLQAAYQNAVDMAADLERIVNHG